MKVCILRETTGACDIYRAIQPITLAAENKKCTVSQLWAANLLYDATNQTKRFWEGMGSDIFFLQRLSGQSLIRRIKDFIKQNGLNSKVVIDFDDNIFSVSPLSNHYVEYGTEEIKIVHNKQVIHEWRHGENIDIKENKKRLGDVKRNISLADAITVTNENLAKIYSQFNPNIKILPNCADLKKWNKVDINRKNKEEIRIGWAGGHSHFEDLLILRDPLIEIAKRNPNVKIVMIGYKISSMEKSFRPEQFEFHDWDSNTGDHPYRMATMDLDIALIPLKENPFNICKSAIKWIEFSSLGIPCISSYVTPYKEMADINENNGFYIDKNDKQGWIDGIEMLINSKELRNSIGGMARKTVEENFDANKTYIKWIDAFKEVQNGRTAEPNFK